MAILIDFNQIILASLFASIGNHHNIEVDENLIRHMFLNSLRSNRKKFHQEYGEIIICADGKNSWRKSVFPYYKANRKKSREESELDWNQLFDIINNIRTELKDYFPYKVIHIETSEADDIIGTICHEKGTILNNGSENYLILSGDKDYIQLQKYANIKQYDPVHKKWINNNDPEGYLKEHIIKGDKGDGVPNVLSSDNCLVIGERQKSITEKRMKDLFRGVEFMDENTKIKYFRNKTLIDLSETPKHLKETILEEFYKDKNVKREKLFNYFVEKKLKNLIEDIQDF